MANVNPSIVRKLKKVLSHRFPPPAKIKIDNLGEDMGIIGVVAADEFHEIDAIDRQKLFRQLLEGNLTPEERRKIQIIVGVTHYEGTGYLDSV